MDDTLVVPTGKGLNIGNDVTLKVPSGQDADIRGTVNVAEDAAIDFREIPTIGGGTVTLSGTITVAAGGEFYGPVAGTGGATPQLVFSGGKIVLKGGSTAYMTAIPIMQVGLDGTGAFFEWASTTTENDEVWLGDELFTLIRGEVTVKNGNPSIHNGSIETGATLKIDGSQTLSIRSSCTLTVKGTLDVTGTIKGDANDSKITIVSGTISGAGANNFYSGGSPTTVTAGQSYTWSTTDSRWDLDP
jgi:hypothetical protein